MNQMNHTRFDVLADFTRAVLASFAVGLIWSVAAICLVLVIVRTGGAT
jgi:hypothetical protein